MNPVRLLPTAPPELVQRLAYRFWQERGEPVGSPDVDWFQAETSLRERILALRPRVIVCGVDDFATGAALTSGWAYFALPQSAVPQFAHRADAILRPTGLTEFHASENFKTSPTAFEEFLKLIRDTVQSHFYSMICVSSNSEHWADDITGFAERVIHTSFQQAGISDLGLTRACKACAPPLFTLLRVLEDFGDTIELQLEVDQDSVSAPFTSLSTNIRGKPVTARKLFAVALDAYRKEQFPNTPAPKRDGTGITVMGSEKSWMVQASDVLGNFAMNFAFRDSGPTTPGRLQKAQIFENVFGSYLLGPSAKHFVSKRGDEITPAQSGAVDFRIVNLPVLELSL